MQTIYGTLYECQTCPRVIFCKKCHGNIERYHLIDDGQLHSFGIDSEAGGEYIVIAPNSPTLSISLETMNSKAGTEVIAQGDGLLVPPEQSRSGSPQDDATEVVDFSDLKDLGSFTDSD